MTSIVLAVWYWEWLIEGESMGAALRNVAVIVAAAVALPLALARIRVVGDQADTADRSLANDRYQRGAEMLGHEKVIVRIGGIDALKEIAQQYPNQYLLPAMRLFCAFLRDNCRADPQVPMFTDRLDLQAAVEAISAFEPERRGTIHSGNNLDSLNLNGVDSYDATLRELNFAGMDLRTTEFTDCNFAGANLRGAYFRIANMEGAILDGARIDGTHFTSEVEGLTQIQLDQATAEEDQAPKLNGACDHETGEPLVWKPSERSQSAKDRRALVAG